MLKKVLIISLCFILSFSLKAATNPAYSYGEITATYNGYNGSGDSIMLRFVANGVVYMLPPNDTGVYSFGINLGTYTCTNYSHEVVNCAPEDNWWADSGVSSEPIYSMTPDVAWVTVSGPTRAELIEPDPDPDPDPELEVITGETPPEPPVCTTCGEGDPDPDPEEILGGTPPPSIPPPPSCPSGSSESTNESGERYCATESSRTEYVKKYNDIVFKGSGQLNLTKITETMKDSGYRSDYDFIYKYKDKGDKGNGFQLVGSNKLDSGYFLNYLNIPESNTVQLSGNTWSPQIDLGFNNNNLGIPKLNTGVDIDSVKWDATLEKFKATGNSLELATHQVNDLSELKIVMDSGGLKELFESYKNISNTKNNSSKYFALDSSGISNYDNSKIQSSGYYLLISKYTDFEKAEKELKKTPSEAELQAYTHYSFITLNVEDAINILSLPVYNNLGLQVGPNIISKGAQKNNHNITGILYEQFKSLKVPSAFDAKTQTVLLSSNAGTLKLLDSSLTELQITNTIGTIGKVYKILNIKGSYYIASDSGILHLDTKTKEVTKTSIDTKTFDLAQNGDNLYILKEDKVTLGFLDGSDITESNRYFDIATELPQGFTPTTIENLKDVITITANNSQGLTSVIILKSN